MLRRLLITCLAASLTLVAVPVAAAPGGAPEILPAGPGPVVPGSYIVVLDDEHPSAVAREHAAQNGAQIQRVFQHALDGYSARMSERALQRVLQDPRVAFVERETIESISAEGDPTPVPTGVDRIEADRLHTSLRPAGEPNGLDLGGASGSPVAILDTGIQLDHPDLNVAGGVDCTTTSGGGPPWARTYSCDTSTGAGDDGNGHGTHVAGTVGALDNGSGVVGVAPGVDLWSVRVCVNDCPVGAILEGIDWVAGQKEEYQSSEGSDGVDFAAANYSISSADSDASCDAATNSTHVAVCGLVDTGVVFVMSAGNDNRHKVPFPAALSVSAVTDFDGVGGGVGDSTCRTDSDDQLADYSNYGPDVRIAAPGTCILSTYLDGGYATGSGTSMAAPHVTGAVALYLATTSEVSSAQDGEGVAAIEAALIDDAHEVGTTADACSYDGRNGIIDGTSTVVDGGPLLFLNGPALDGDGTCAEAPSDEPTEPVTDLAVTDIDAPASVTTGDEVTVTVTVDNVGTEAAGSGVDISLVASDGSVSGSPATLGADLEAGGSTSVDFTWATAGLDAGTYTLTAMHDLLDDENTTNDTAILDVEVAAEPTPGGEVTLALVDDSRYTGPWWRPAVTATVTSDGSAVTGAVVDMTWSGALSGSGSCTTDAGSCSIELDRVRDPSGDVEVTVTGITISADPVETWDGPTAVTLEH